MTRRDDMMFFLAPPEMKLLIRIRAARQNTTMSAYLRELVQAALGNPTPEEVFFLAADDSKSEQSIPPENHPA